MSGRRRENVVKGGEARVIHEQAPSAAEGLERARTIAAECPEGYHLWRIEIQKSDRGRRASVRVWFQRNAFQREGPT